MYLNKEGNKENSDFFFTAEYSADRHELSVNMTSKGIEVFLQLLNRFSTETQIIISEDKFTKVESNKDYNHASAVLIQHKPIKTDELAINFIKKEHKIYIFCSEKGLKNLCDSLMCLKKGLERGKPDDISYMVPDWGGDWLLNKKYIENSEVIFHLRLYGILG